MSKRESKMRLKRRSKAYRKAMIVINVAFLAVIIFFGIYGALHTFTNKNKYREEGIEAYKAGEYEQAIEAFDKALDSNQWFSKKVDADILLYKAECQVKLEQYEEANQTYTSLKSYHTSNLHDIDLDFLISLNNAYIDFYSADYSSCVDVFVDAYARGYNNLALNIGICYENLKDYDNMYKYYSLYENHFGTDTFICYKLSSYNIRQDNYDEAISYISKGKASGDSRYLKELCYTEILCYEHLSDYKKAYSLAGDYITAYPGDEKGQTIYAYLETRVHPDTQSVNGFFDSEP